MPDSCFHCPFLDYEEGFCLADAIKHDSGWYENKFRPGWKTDGRHESCPLVPVPPHGRGIDADALLNKLQALYDERECEARYTGSKEIKVSWNEAVYQIISAPTIIPADESNEEDDEENEMDSFIRILKD